MHPMNIYDKLLFARHLEADEKLEYVVHKHWFEIFRPTFKVSLFGILPPLFFIVFFTGIDFSNPVFYLILIWLVLGLLNIFYIWMDWYYDAWLLTNQSIIDLEWKGLFERSSARIEYSAVDGVAYELSGFWGFLLGFGDIRIDKVSTQAVSLPNANSPRVAESWILRQQEKFLERKNLTDSNALKEILAEVVKDHIKRKK